MATFTFRIPDSMAGRLSSAEMRAWLSQYLTNSHPLPSDPGPGCERISLTLSDDLVEKAAHYARCSPSAFLRRLALAHLGLQRATIRPEPTSPSTRSRAAAPSGSPPILYASGYDQGPSHDTGTPARTAGEIFTSVLAQLVIYGLIWTLFYMFATRKEGS
jgi:hypothetical protein